MNRTKQRKKQDLFSDSMGKSKPKPSSGQEYSPSHSEPMNQPMNPITEQAAELAELTQTSFGLNDRSTTTEDVFY